MTARYDCLRRGWRRTVSRGLFVMSALTASTLLPGCVTVSDVQSIAQGQFISFINALINTATSDTIRAAIGG